MPNDFSMKEATCIWQEQPAEAFKMSLEQLNRKVQERERAARRSVWVAMATGLVVCGWFAWSAAKTAGLAPRLGLGLISLWGLYYALHGYRWLWPQRLQPEASPDATMHFYRSELEKQFAYVRGIWIKGGLVLCFLGVAIFFLPPLLETLRTPRLLLNFLPLCLLFVVWLAMFIPKRRRSLLKMQHEIEQLQMLEREYRT